MEQETLREFVKEVQKEFPEINLNTVAEKFIERFPDKFRKKRKGIYIIKYNFETFEVNETRFINEHSSRVSAASCIFGKRKGMKFKTRSTGNGTNVTRLV